MEFSRRSVLLAALAISGLVPRPACAGWRRDYPSVALGVVTSENLPDRIVRYQPVIDYLEQALGVRVVLRHAADYAGVIDDMRGRHIHLARFGPASYARAWLGSGGKVEPVAGEEDHNGDRVYHSVLVVRADSPWRHLDDLKGRALAFADPHSTSGFLVPSWFLRQSGYDPATFFGRTGFTGSHETSVIAVLNGTYDAAATWWRNEARSNIRRMEEKGLIRPGQLRILWTSPPLPESLFALHADLPAAMKADLRRALLAMPANGPQAFRILTDGTARAFFPARHQDYEPIIRMIQETQPEGS